MSNTGTFTIRNNSTGMLEFMLVSTTNGDITTLTNAPALGFLLPPSLPPSPPSEIVIGLSANDEQTSGLVLVFRTRFRIGMVMCTIPYSGDDNKIEASGDGFTMNSSWSTDENNAGTLVVTDALIHLVSLALINDTGFEDLQVKPNDKELTGWGAGEPTLVFKNLDISDGITFAFNNDLPVLALNNEFWNQSIYWSQSTFPEYRQSFLAAKPFVHIHYTLTLKSEGGIILVGTIDSDPFPHQ